MMLEKTLENPLDFKAIKTVKPNVENDKDRDIEVTGLHKTHHVILENRCGMPQEGEVQTG